MQAVNKLKQLQSQHHIKIRSLEAPSDSGLFLVEFMADDKSWEIYLEDEYQEFDQNQWVRIFLVLRVLEDYREAKDWEAWCRLYFLEPTPQWESYHKHLKQIYHEIEKQLGGIDSFINPLDYQLKSGSYHYLLKLKD